MLAAVVLLLAFALGVLTGTIVERHRSTRPTKMMSAEGEHRAAMAELTELLDLDDEQVAQIYDILHRHRGIVQRTWEELRPAVQSAMQQVHIEIGEMLRPDQRKKFHQWLMERRDQHHEPASLIPLER
jgi:Spy/CpxP family protein refolding chaperone